MASRMLLQVHDRLLFEEVAPVNARAGRGPGARRWTLTRSTSRWKSVGYGRSWDAAAHWYRACIWGVRRFSTLVHAQHNAEVCPACTRQ